jgi:hypothetical protein
LDWFARENLNWKHQVFTIKIMGVSGFNFPTRMIPVEALKKIMVLPTAKWIQP